MNLPKSANGKKKKEQQLEGLNNTTYSAVYILSEGNSQ